jgi:hypothetical protein
VLDHAGVVFFCVSDHYSAQLSTLIARPFANRN